MNRSSAEQMDLLPADALRADAPSPAVIHVSSHVRRRSSDRRAIGVAPAPLPMDTLARNRWVIEKLDGWRKADHAASQQRSEGRKCNRQAEVFEGSGLFREEADAREKAERCFELAGQHEARAAGIFAQIAGRLR